MTGVDPRQLGLPFQEHSPTSAAAAELAAPRAPIQRQRVLDALRERGERGMTDEELQRALRMNPSTERPRRIELVRARLVRDSGRTRHTKSRRKAVVWIIATPKKGSP